VLPSVGVFDAFPPIAPVKTVFLLGAGPAAPASGCALDSHPPGGATGTVFLPGSWPARSASGPALVAALPSALRRSVVADAPEIIALQGVGFVPVPGFGLDAFAPIG